MADIEIHTAMWQGEALLSFLTQDLVRTGFCTCCPDGGRPTVRFGGDHAGEWGHIDDEMYAEMRHVHIESDSSDCDGQYEHGTVYVIGSIRAEALFPTYMHSSSGKTEPDFHDLWTYVIRHEPRGAYSEFEATEIRLTTKRVEWSCRTEEGGESGAAWVCDDHTCDREARHYRDRTAERAGY